MHEEPDDLRDDVLAVLRAGAELPRDDQSYLADVFVRHLHEQYDLTRRPEDGVRRRRGTGIGARSRQLLHRHRRSLRARVVAALLLVAVTMSAGIEIKGSSGLLPISGVASLPERLQHVNGEVMTYPSLGAVLRDVPRQQAWGYRMGTACRVKPNLIRVVYVPRRVTLNPVTVHWWQARGCNPGA